MISEEERAQVLAEALPYLRRYHGKSLVIKYGGAAMADERLKQSVIQGVVLLHFVGIRPVLVHGGGPEVTEAMKKVGKVPTFVGGLRVTDAETVEIVEMVLTGKTNKGIVSMIHRQGGKAVGLSGKDGNLFVARRLKVGDTDLGFVGEVTQVNTEVLEPLAEHGFIPVISSVAMGEEGETLNINADHVAGRLAAALRAEKLILLTDVPGLLEDVQRPESLLSEIGIARARELLASGCVERGMIPKVEACLMALEGGVPRAHIIDGRRPHALLTELFTDRGIGTMIRL
ncbi:MAG: acetylglutamate kinase [Armatimonadetes bacterium]|nr:acetylglutamate kinase [Armatimonadota bacterium]